MPDLIVGCSLAICGNFVISISLNLQKYTHMKLEGSSTHYTRKPIWWLGVILMGVGEIGNFSAYGFAPASLVAPLGTTTVIVNMIIAAVFLKERIKPEHIFGKAALGVMVSCPFLGYMRSGSTLAVIGAILLVTFSNSDENLLGGNDIMKLLKKPLLITYMILELVLLALLFFLLYARHMKYVVIYLLITSLLASFTVISAKGISSMLQLSIMGVPQFTYAIFYIMVVVLVVTAIMQIKYVNVAMKGYDATVVVPTNFVFFTISAILAGAIFYQEFEGMTPINVCIFLFGCCLCFTGVYFITTKFNQPHKLPTPHSVDEPKDPRESSSTRSQISNIIPSWLTASVNTSRVQPGDCPVTMPDERSLLRQSLKDEISSDTSDDDTYAHNLPPPCVTVAHVSVADYGAARTGGAEGGRLEGSVES